MVLGDLGGNQPLISVDKMTMCVLVISRLAVVVVLVCIHIWRVEHHVESGSVMGVLACLPVCRMLPSCVPRALMMMW